MVVDIEKVVSPEKGVLMGLLRAEDALGLLEHPCYLGLGHDDLIGLAGRGGRDEGAVVFVVLVVAFFDPEVVGREVQPVADRGADSEQAARVADSGEGFRVGRLFEGVEGVAEDGEEEDE